MGKFIFSPAMLPVREYIFQADDTSMTVSPTAMEFISAGITLAYSTHGVEHMFHIDGDADRGWTIQHSVINIETGEQLRWDRYRSNGGETDPDSPVYGLPFFFSPLTPESPVPAA